MKIESLSFCYLDSRWQFSDLKLENLTLLVGASGVGKTRILDCILELKLLAFNYSNGLDRRARVKAIEWSVEFTLVDGQVYEWNGTRNKKGYFEKEGIGVDGITIANRIGSAVVLENDIELKLNNDASLLYLLGENDVIKPILEAFRTIIYSNWELYSTMRDLTHLMNESQLGQYGETIDEIRTLKEDSTFKLFLAKRAGLPIVDEIKQRFIDIFPFVEDVLVDIEKLMPYDGGEEEFMKIHIYLKEVGVKEPVHHSQVSSGMYRTFLLLCDLYLSPDGTVFLIDEFENSLGINCIDEVTTVLQSFRNRNLQFIITSHHPYIINNIHYKNWKLVTRRGGEVIAQDASDLIDFSMSRQQAFMQLTQLEEFTTGISE
jgi:ABC-type lipoprotein export system ATPase subunit